jgi:polyisoprenoid-binding protein YceI
MMVGKVKGRFTRFSGEIVTAEGGAQTVSADIELDSVDTQNAQRDEHIRSGDFFDAATHPTMTYRSTGLRRENGRLVVDGELSLHGVTRPVPLELELGGVTKDPYGFTRAGFTATAEIDRREFDITIQMPMDGGGVVVGDKVRVALEIEAVLQQAA